MTLEGLHNQKICAGEYQSQVNLVMKNRKNHNSSQIIKSTQLATHIFSNLVTHVDFLQLKGYINIQQASGFNSNFARISFQKFLCQLQLILHIQGTYILAIYYIIIYYISYTLNQTVFSQRQLTTTNVLSIKKDLAEQCTIVVKAFETAERGVLWIEI